ncbi:MAG: redoxin domain-containing protein [Methanosarcinales archaeon]|nr:redoxin domain-containing protein [Methanosarcinales archaeon]
MNLKKNIVLASVVLILFFVMLSGCVENETVTDSEVGEAIDWRNVELTDARTGEIFSISDFEGPILVESFAVWCPTCLQQQKEMKKLIQIEGENITHISLDTDPNEDVEAVLDHVQRNDLDWYFAVAPTEMTEDLIDEFGIEVANAPFAPVILICEDGEARLLGRGLKSAEELNDEVMEGC